MTEARVPGGIASMLTIAALTWRRLVRGRALWASVVIAVLPVIYAAATRGRLDLFGSAEDIYAFEMLVLMVLAPMFIASSIGEDIEDRTSTYLWSRPVPRWSVVAGKLLTLVPVTLAMSVGSWALALVLRDDPSTPLVRSCVALAAGGLVISMAAAALASLVPKHGLALTILFLWFFDLPLGVMPAKLRALSISEQIRVLSGIYHNTGIATAVIALAVMTAVWAAIMALRIRRLEV